MTERYVSPQENRGLIFSPRGVLAARLAYAACYGLLSETRDQFIAEIKGVEATDQNVVTCKSAEFRSLFNEAMLELPTTHGYPLFVDSYAAIASDPDSLVVRMGERYLRNLRVTYQQGPRAVQLVVERARELAHDSFARDARLKELEASLCREPRDSRGKKVIPGFAQELSLLDPRADLIAPPKHHLSAIALNGSRCAV